MAQNDQAEQKSQVPGPQTGVKKGLPRRSLQSRRIRG